MVTFVNFGGIWEFWNWAPVINTAGTQRRGRPGANERGSTNNKEWWECPGGERPGAERGSANEREEQHKASSNRHHCPLLINTGYNQKRPIFIIMHLAELKFNEYIFQTSCMAHSSFCPGIHVCIIQLINPGRTPAVPLFVSPEYVSFYSLHCILW